MIGDADIYKKVFPSISVGRIGQAVELSTSESEVPSSNPGQ